MVASLVAKVATFQRPFEARSTDPVRREVFLQPGSRAAWFAPVFVPQGTPVVLAPAREVSRGPVPKPKRGRR